MIFKDFEKVAAADEEEYCSRNNIGDSDSDDYNIDGGRDLDYYSLCYKN